MIGLDSNVLVRYIVQDDPEQAAAASRLIEGHCTERSPGHINLVVLVELVWVLTSGYRQQREDVARVVLQLLRTTEFDIEETAAVWAAVREFEAGTADFADYLIARRNRDAGCERTYTFDRKAATGKHFAEVP